MTQPQLPLFEVMRPDGEATENVRYIVKLVH